MKRTLLTFSSAIALGALAGFLVSDFPRQAPSQPQHSRAVSAAVPGATLASTLPPARSTAFVRMLGAATAVFDHARGRDKAATVGLLLKEPVVVVHAGEGSQSRLAEGTRVDLVKNEGRFLRVRHDHTVVTIPRSAVVLGVTQAN